MKKEIMRVSAKRSLKFRPVLLKSSIVLLLFFSLYSCKKKEDTTSPPAQTIAQIVYTSDLHYGISRTFRGATVDASIVNKALISQINTIPTSMFPNDGGLNAGKTIGAVDYLIITGDISNREQTGPPDIQSATISWGQFASDYFNGITLTNQNNQKTTFLLESGNHDVSNAIGYTKPMNPATDPTVMVNLYNLMIAPATLKTNSTYNYNTDKINYSKDVVGVHLMFVNMWPDSTERIWMEADLAKVNVTTPVIIFTHDQPECEAKHFTNPNGNHDINSTDKFENMVAERLKDGTTTKAETTLEQKTFVAFLLAHPNIKAYFHGNDNKNEFYLYKGPDNNINLSTFRVDSPMKGTVSGLDADDGIGDETKLSFQTIVIDGAAKKLTVRECLWNTTGATSKIQWGSTSTISLN